MELTRIIKYMLYLDDEEYAAKFLSECKTMLDVQKACSDQVVASRAAFINAFFHVLKCLPSSEIVKQFFSQNKSFGEYVKDVILPVFDKAHLDKIYTNSVFKSKTPLNVRNMIVSHLLHVQDSHLKNNLVALFFDVFKGGSKQFELIDQTLNSVFSNKLLLAKCLDSICVICEVDQFIDPLLRACDRASNKKVHVFSFQSHNQLSKDFIIHNDDHKLYPLAIFKHIVRLKKNNTIDIDSKSFNICKLDPELMSSVVEHSLKSNTTNVLEFWNLVSTYVWSLVKPSTFTNKQHENAIVALDTRMNPLTVMACLTSAHMVDKDSWRGVIVFCNKEHVSYYEAKLGSAMSCVIGLDELSIRKFDIDDYNNVMKSEIVWKQLHDLGVKKALIVQDDGFLIREKVERFLSYDYVGAPWNPDQPLLKSLSNPDMVGNGGLSLRSVDAMLNIVMQKKEQDIWPQTFSQLPEDVFFANRVWKSGFKVCPRYEACLFSSEQVPSKNCCGVHKPWPYMSAQDLKSLFTQ